MVSKSNIKAFALFLFALSSRIFAQSYDDADVPAVSKGDLQFYADHSVYKGDTEKLYAEFYLMLFADQLKSISRDGKNISEFTVTTLITDSYQNEVSRKEWTTEALINGAQGSASQAIYDQWNENLKPGKYNIKIDISDKNSSNKGQIKSTVQVSQINDSSLSASQVEFVSGIDTNKSAVHFLKCDRSVMPNPSRRYGVLNPILYLYYELYNIETGGDGKLTINYSVIAKSSEVVKKFPSFEIDKNISTTGLTHGLNVGDVPSGIYDLKINILDSGNNKSLEITRRFEVVQKDYADRKSALAGKDAEQFEKLLKIIGTPQQNKIYSSLDMNAKAGFIVQFWKNEDPSPGTSENEYLEQIQQRFQYANKNFSWGKNPGAESERGRVLIQYGMPDEIEPHYFDAGNVPYEVWSYRKEKEYIFIFGDLQSNGRFVLLHSTKEGEIYNENWMEYVSHL